MDILIKNMKMPKGDIPLVLIITSDGTVEEIDDSDEINATDAKAIEIPPHDELISRDKLREAMKERFCDDCSKECSDCEFMGSDFYLLDIAPTVLERTT